MPEEPDRSAAPEQPRTCPQCGCRVATLASTCLLCGCELEGELVEEPVASAPDSPRRIWPRMVRGASIAGLTLVIIAAGLAGLVALSNREGGAVSATAAPPTRTPRPTATGTSVPTVAESPTPFLTPTPIPPRSHQVQQDETLSEIAAEYDVTIDEIMQFNADLDPELLQVGQVLLVPPDLSVAGVSSPGASDDPSATRADFVVHVVRSGDALLSIAEKYGVSVQAIRRANDIGLYEDTLQVNQSLIIPLAEPTATATPTAHPDATPTQRPPYAAPPLLTPIDGRSFSGPEEPLMLQWASVGILRDNEWYLVKLELQQGGAFSATHTTRTTSWRIPLDLISSAGAGEHVFRWQVQVVQEIQRIDGGGAYAAAGARSDVREFRWVGPEATPPASS